MSLEHSDRDAPLLEVPPRTHKVPTSNRFWLTELVARLRGEHTLSRMRKAGLRASDSVYIGPRVHMDKVFAWAITIGANTRIAHDVSIIAHDAATKHLTGYTEVRPVVIGAGCYIGAGVIVLPGAKIGNGTVVGAGAVVRGEIPEGVVAAGNPAKVIRQVSELREQHSVRQNRLPLFDKRPMDGLTASELARLQKDLVEYGRLYVR